MKKNLYQENINFVALFFIQIVVLNAGRRRLGVSDLRGKVHFLILAYLIAGYQHIFLDQEIGQEF